MEVWRHIVHRAVPASLGFSAFLAAVAGQTPGTHSKLVVTPDRSIAWALGQTGSITQLDLRPGVEPRSVGWDPPAPVFEDIAISGDGRTLYGLVAAIDGRTTLLVSYDTGSLWRETARHEIRGRGRFLEVTGTGLAAVVGTRPRAGKPRPGSEVDQADDWSLTVIDLGTQAVTGPIRLGLVPQTVAWVEPRDAAPRLLIAAGDRIVSYGLAPPRASWFYKSPGDHAELRASENGSILCVLRSGRLALFDPARRPRLEGRVQLTDDDAALLVDLPAPAIGLALSADGGMAAALHRDGRALSLIDLGAGQVMSTETLSDTRGLIGPRIIEGAGGDLIVLLGSPAPETGQGLSTLAFGRPAPVIPAPPEERETVAPPTRVPVPELPAERLPEPPAEPAAERPGEPPAEPAPEEPPARATPAPTPSPPPAVAPEPTRRSDEPALTGTITGEQAAAKEVLLYGPDSIIKVFARAVVREDGTFRFALPPAGRYRIVVKGPPGAHLFTRPEFRMIDLGADGQGVAGIDFEVRGRL